MKPTPKSSSITFTAALALMAPHMSPWPATAIAAFLLLVGIAQVTQGD